MLLRDLIVRLTIIPTGGREGAEQTGNARGSLSRFNQDYESGTADVEGAGDFLSYRCPCTLQFDQKRAGRGSQKTGEFIPRPENAM